MASTSVGSIRAQFEQKIAEHEHSTTELGGMYLPARLTKQTRSPRKSPTKPSRPPISPKKTSRIRQNIKQSFQCSGESVTSRTISESESDGSSELKLAGNTTAIQPYHSPKREKPKSTAKVSLSPQQSPKRERNRCSGMMKRNSICRPVDIPRSIDEEKEEMVGCTIIMCDEKADLEGSLVLNFDDEAAFAVQSPRKGSMMNTGNDSYSQTSQGSTLSRTSPQIRRLPRDLDFDSDDSSMSDDDSEGLAKHRQTARKALPKPRFW